MKSRIVVFVSLIAFGICKVGAVSDEAQQPTLADYTLGEKWVWKFKGVTSEGIVRADDADMKEVVSSDGMLYLAGESSKVPLMEVVQPETSATPRFSWPLKVGKRWIFEQTWTSQDGTTGKSRFDAEVVSFKPEHVDAGTFMAYTIIYTGKITNSRGYSADTDEIFWYAPATKNFIKLIQTQQDYVYEEELVDYVKPE